MKFIAFFFREGSSVLYSAYIASFALNQGCLICLNGGSRSMFIVALIGLAYLAMQNGMAAFSRVGNDRPLMDFFFSLLPVFTLAMIAVLILVKVVTVTSFEAMALWLAAIISFIDVVFNTQVIFKMNRLASDMVSMR